jgi:hypothetical protein
LKDPKISFVSKVLTAAGRIESYRSTRLPFSDQVSERDGILFRGTKTQGI